MLKIYDPIYCDMDGELNNYDGGVLIGRVQREDEGDGFIHIQDAVYNFGVYAVKSSMIKEKRKAMSKVKWVGEANKVKTSFAELDVGEYFQIDTNNSKGAVYQKVEIDSSLVNSYGQLEVQINKVFRPTSSKIKVVEGELVLQASKPNIY